jgi:hypothetical protein
VDVEAVADELYQQDPASFTSRRDAQVAAARQEGDRPAAAAIKALKRPSPPAWAVNLLARTSPDEVDALGDLGARLREAQATLSGEELRALTRERHKFIVGLARQARTLAADHGHPLSPTAGRQVEDTLNAALADPEAAVAVASGRLVRSLEHAGMGPVELDGAVAGPGSPVARPARGARKSEPDLDGSAQARILAELEEVRAEAAAADEQLRSAEKAAGEAASTLESASRVRAEADSEVRGLEAQLDSARSRAEAARLEAGVAWRAHQQAERALEASRRRVRDAQDRLTKIDRQRPPTGK